MALEFGRIIHPGEILHREFMEPLGLKSYTLAKKLNVPRTRIERLIAEKTPVTPDTALRLAKFFDNTPEFWLNMQAAHDLAKEADMKKSDLEKIHSYREGELAA